jgi:DNA-binding MarR family transcriptional regulator
MLDKMSDTSRIVDRLVIKGLAVKKVCSTDKRLVDVNITKEGKRILEVLDKKQPEMSSITNNLTDAELKQLNSLLDNLRSRL